MRGEEVYIVFCGYEKYERDDWMYLYLRQDIKMNKTDISSLRN